MYENYEEYQDSFPTYREWKIMELIVPTNWDDMYGVNLSEYHTRHQRRKYSYAHCKVGPYRNWKRYRMFQYRN